jgi:hypothetical protein
MWFVVFEGGGETLVRESPSDRVPGAAIWSPLLLSDPFRVSGRAKAARIETACRASPSQIGYQMFFRMRLAQMIGPTTLHAFPNAVKKKKALALSNVISHLLEYFGIQLTSAAEE